MLTPAVVHSGQADKVLQERAEVMVLAYSRNPERFVHGAPMVKPFPKEVWINKPLAPDSQKPPTETKSIPLEKCPQEFPSLLETGESVRKGRMVFQGFEMTFGIGVII